MGQLSGVFPIQKSDYYKMYIAELDEIEKLKWLESERVGYDIGMERARWLWMTTHRTTWVTFARTGLYSDYR